MSLLVLDTCAAEGTVAVSTGERVLTGVIPPRESASVSLKVVRSLLEEAGIALKDLAAIAVVNGPGSFTGVRVGVGLVMGLAESVGLPVIALSRLQVLLRLADGKAEFAALDAGRDLLYFAGPAGEELITLAELTQWTDGAAVAVCEAKLAERLAAYPLAQVANPTAADALPLAVEALREGRAMDAGALDAHYLRRPDAELALKGR